MAVNFYLDNKKDKKGESPIRVSIMIGGIRFITSSGLKIDSSKWDSRNQRVKKKATSSIGTQWSIINEVLNKIESHFGAVESEYLTSGKQISIEWIKDEFTRVFRNKNKKSIVNSNEFWEYYDMFIKERGTLNQWRRPTYQKFKTLQSHLKDWRKKIDFNDFDEAGLNSFMEYMRDTLQMKNTTSGKLLNFLKWFLRWATLKGYNTNLAFQSYSPKLRQATKRVVFLEWGELMRVLNYSIPPNGTVVKLHRADGVEYEKVVSDAGAIAKARDIFCFCCFTSLRYSDANNLKRADIKEDSITITTVKTGDTITIELNKYAKGILDKYKDVDSGIYAFPRMTNQRMNIYLKDLCELCEINEPFVQTYYRGVERIDETRPKYEYIGTHTGRRTFICNALMMGIPAEIVMKWTGHSDYKSMKPYIDVTNAAKSKAMEMFNKI